MEDDLIFPLNVNMYGQHCIEQLFCCQSPTCNCQIWQARSSNISWNCSAWAKLNIKIVFKNKYPPHLTQTFWPVPGDWNSMYSLREGFNNLFMEFSIWGGVYRISITFFRGKKCFCSKKIQRLLEWSNSSKKLKTLIFIYGRSGQISWMLV